MTDLLTENQGLALLIACGIGLVVWFGISIYRFTRFHKNRAAFKAGTYRPTDSKTVVDLVSHIGNYDLPRPWADTKKFTCATCCSNSLVFTHKTHRILYRLKKEVKDKIYNILSDCGLFYDDYYEGVEAFQFYPSENANLDFQYLVGNCGGCKRYIADFMISGGQCGEKTQPLPTPEGDDVA